VDGFSSFTAASKHVKSEGPVDKLRKLLVAKATISLAKDSADIVLTETDIVVQNLFVQESTLVASAQFKDAVRANVCGMAAKATGDSALWFHAPSVAD
jgi:hypothetical protein